MKKTHSSLHPRPFGGMESQNICLENIYKIVHGCVQLATWRNGGCWCPSSHGSSTLLRHLLSSVKRKSQLERVSSCWHYVPFRLIEWDTWLMWTGNYTICINIRASVLSQKYPWNIVHPFVKLLLACQWFLLHKHTFSKLIVYDR